MVVRGASSEDLLDFPFPGSEKLRWRKLGVREKGGVPPADFWLHKPPEKLRKDEGCEAGGVGYACWWPPSSRSTTSAAGSSISCGRRGGPSSSSSPFPEPVLGPGSIAVGVVVVMVVLIVVVAVGSNSAAWVVAACNCSWAPGVSGSKPAADSLSVLEGQGHNR